MTDRDGTFPLGFRQPYPMHLAPRDQAILALLDRTPVTASQLLKASATFPDGAFRDERRLRERMQTLMRGKLAQNYSLAVSGGGLANYYRLTPEGFRLLHGADKALPHRSAFSVLSPSRIAHTIALADAIVHSFVAAYRGRAAVTGFHGENGLTLEIGSHRTAPDCHMQFQTAGRTYNVLLELDRSTESIDSEAVNSIRSKLLAYEAYQDHVLRVWKQGGYAAQRPAFRVVFLTLSSQRSHHILALARECARNPDRRICFATSLDEFLTTDVALHSPIFLDHHGRWQSLVNVHPSSGFVREPVRIAPFVQPSLFV